MWGDPEESFVPRNSPRRGTRLVIIGVFVLVIGAGVFLISNAIRKENGDGQHAQRASLLLEQHELQDDPSADGWTTEIDSDRATKQLKIIRSWLIRPDLIDESKARRLVSEEFVCAQLRPSHLERVFDKSPIYVDRSTSIETTELTYRGHAGFVDAVSNLIKPFRESRLQDANFKIFSISNADNSFLTRQYVTLIGETDEGRVEENATWTARWTNEKTPRLLAIETVDFERAFVSRSTPILADCTESVLSRKMAEDDVLGFGVGHWCARIPTHYGMHCVGHHGLAVGDVNGDGLEDVYVCHPAGIPNQLFIQNADGTVTDHAKSSGVDWLDSTASALFVDLDNDDDQDLVLGMLSHLLIMKNEGDSTFRRAYTTKSQGVITSLACADYDNDGYLDIYVCCYEVPGIGPLPFHDANNGCPNTLFRNDGNWVFNDKTHVAGLNENNARFTWAACWEDFDNDGDLDLYVANDYGRNCLYKNSNGKFADIANSSGVEDIASGMSVSFGDYDHDGRMDLYVGNMFSSAGNRIAFQRQFNPVVSTDARAQFQRHARGNSLFRSLPDGTFEDVSERTGVTMGRWAWCSRFIDFNNDSFEDLFVVNGYVTNTNPDDL